MSKIPISQVATAVLIIGLSVIVVLLVIKNHELQERIKLGDSRIEILEPGQQVDALNLLTLDGVNKDVELKRQYHRTLLYVFSTSCPACLNSVPSWNEIANIALQKKYLLFAISINDIHKTNEYYKKHNLMYPVYSVRDTSFRTKYKIAYIPQTILISEHGIVQKIWGGRIDSIKQADIIREIQ